MSEVSNSELQGKRVFITGSARGVGRGIAELAISRGAQVVISDFDEDRVNAVCPGVADTSMVDRLAPEFEAATDAPFGDLVAAKQGRLGTVEDIAEVACFLASDRASWVTGSHYVLDGGLTASLV